MNLILLQVVSLIYILLLNIFYLSKKHLNTIENNIYKYLLISNVIGLLIEFGCFYTVSNITSIPLINIVVTKGLLIYYLWFVTLYTFYVIVIAYKDDVKGKNTKFLKKVQIYCLIGWIITSLITVSFPMYYYSSEKYVYSYGPAVNCLSIILIICMSLWGIIIIRKYKTIKNQKYLPVIIFIVLAGIGGVIQNIYPYILISTPIESLVIFLMYFTIENPDMKMVKEIADAKLISDNANEEKTLFLYNMTREIRETTKNIDVYSDEILHRNSPEEDKEDARNIKGETAKFRTMTNDILDVSAIDQANIKIYNSKYDLKLLLKSLVGKYSEICQNQMLNFITNIEHDIPQKLNGDSINLKKAIDMLLTYACKNTKKGYIELDVNTIIKKDICRLIITIEDSGIGIQASDLEKLKIEDKQISEVYKLVISMNGAMVITSNYGEGNKIKIIIDQKIETADKNQEKYYDIYNNKKILIVDDNDASIKIIEKMLKTSEITIEAVNTGKDAYDKIKTKTRYDLILIDEQLNQISGEELLKYLQNIRNFNIPVILMSKDNRYEYNEAYLKNGFNDILIKPINKDDLITKLEKYLDK